MTESLKGLSNKNMLLSVAKFMIEKNVMGIIKTTLNHFFKDLTYWIFLQNDHLMCVWYSTQNTKNQPGG